MTRLLQGMFVVVLAIFSPYLTQPVGAVYCSYGWDLNAGGSCDANDLQEILDEIDQECSGETAAGCEAFCGCAYGVVTDICTGVIDWRCSDTDCPVQWCDWDEDCCAGGCWEGQCEEPFPTYYE